MVPRSYWRQAGEGPSIGWPLSVRIWTPACFVVKSSCKLGALIVTMAVPRVG